MRKVIISAVLALVIAGGGYFLRTEFSRDVAPPHSSTSAPAADASGAEGSPEAKTDEAAWLKLRDRLNDRRAEAPSVDPESEPDAQEGAQPPVFDTHADLLAAAGVTPEEEAEALKWAFERGLETHSLGYEFYDRDTLQALAESGDIFALQRLADHAAWNEQAFTQAEVLYRDAAVRGSVLALDRLALNETAKALAADDDQRDVSRQHLVKALVWTEVSRRRSGSFLMPDVRENNVLEHLENIDITLSDADREAISDQADALYQNLSETRADLGFGAFDNSKPAMVEKLERQGLDKASIRNP